jgi:hypothetical protein
MLRLYKGEPVGPSVMVESKPQSWDVRVGAAQTSGRKEHLRTRPAEMRGTDAEH